MLIDGIFFLLFLNSMGSIPSPRSLAFHYRGPAELLRPTVCESLPGSYFLHHYGVSKEERRRKKRKKRKIHLLFLLEYFATDFDVLPCGGTASHVGASVDTKVRGN